jgi:hypothetical protein
MKYEKDKQHGPVGLDVFVGAGRWHLHGGLSLPEITTLPHTSEKQSPDLSFVGRTVPNYRDLGLTVNV